MNILQQIQAYDIPTDSFVHAIAYMKEKYPDMDPSQAQDMIETISGQSYLICAETDDPVMYELVLLYLIQETIRFSKTSFPPDITTNLHMLIYAAGKAYNYYETHTWAFVKPEVEQPTIDPLTGKTKMKKGHKQDQADKIYQQFRTQDKSIIIEQLQQQLDMSKAGARTYYYNLRKKYNDE